MKITMLGTGNALVSEVYNTCYVLTDEEKQGTEKYFMVDAGGGGQIVHQMKYAGLNWMDMREIFLTHKHIDHFTGMIWMVRLITQNMKSGKYEGEANIYGHKEVIELLDDISRKLLQPGQVKFIGDRLHLIPVEDGETRVINGHKVTFFDIGSTKAMSRITLSSRRSTRRGQTGCFMRHSAFMRSGTASIRMRSITPR